MIPRDHYIAFTDGGARPNPGHAGCGFAIYRGTGPNEHNEHPICTGYRYLGNKQTNNFAEYNGVLEALQTIRTIKPKSTVIATDSALVIKQLTGIWKIHDPKLKHLADQIKREINHHDRVTFQHVRGHRGVPGNESADKLATLALTTKTSNIDWIENPTDSEGDRNIIQRLRDIERRVQRLESAVS